MSYGLPVQYIRQGAVAEIDRTVYIPLVKGGDYVTPWNNTPVGSPKAKIAFDGAAAADTTNALTMTDTTNLPGLGQVVLAEEEVATRGTYIVSFNQGGASGLVRVVISDGAEQDFGTTERAQQYRAGRPSA